MNHATKTIYTLFMSKYGWKVWKLFKQYGSTVVFRAGPDNWYAVNFEKDLDFQGDKGMDRFLIMFDITWRQYEL